jgi:heparosan-N-sulfate-glucuronate 5-epimerase
VGRVRRIRASRWSVAILFVCATAAAEPAIRRKELDAAALQSRERAIRLYKTSASKHKRALSWPIEQYFCRRYSGLIPEDARFTMDGDGLPQQRHALGNYYHPLTLARHVINMAVTYMNRKHDPLRYVQTTMGADKLVAIMGPDGAFRHPYPYRLYYYGDLRAGWTSALAQGTALSAFARAYHITCDERYRRAGDKALEHLLTPIENGGTATSLRHLDSSLAGYVWYEEYPNPNKPAYTLAGYMYTLLGLHEWAETTGSIKAKTAFEEGVRSLARILPYFDYDGFSSYDLAPILYGKPILFLTRYHRADLDLLSGLYAITKNPVLEEYRVKWYATVGGPVETCGGS